MSQVKERKTAARIWIIGVVFLSIVLIVIVWWYYNQRIEVLEKTLE